LRRVNPTRRLLLPLVLLAAALSLLLATGAGAAAHKRGGPTIHPPAKVQVRQVRVGHTPGGRLALLVGVRYPIEAANRALRVGVHVRLPGHRVPMATGTAARLNAGAPRLADRRREFTFVHEIDLRPRIAKAIESTWAEGRAPIVTVEAQSGIDIDADGRPDIRQKGVPRRVVHLRPGLPRRGHPTKAPKQLCATVPVVSTPAGAGLRVDLPACATAVDWKIATPPAEGSARLDLEHLDLTAPGKPGTETVKLNRATVVVKVGPRASAALAGIGPSGPVVRAMGDSVTAGFGYYSNATLMPFTSLLECKPEGQVLDDACSSNSTATADGAATVPYAPDYGLANNVSWAAQWANEYGVTNYKNFAVSGSEPVNWAPGGSLYATTKQIESEDPDYILMTVGANPILADTLFGVGPAACALESDVLGRYSECVAEAFAAVHLERELKAVYTDLVKNTNATIYLMQYHLSVPASAILYSSTQIAEMAKMMNATIAKVAAEVSPGRLKVVAPTHFNVGVDLEPVYPSSYTCSYFEYGVDGPSVQSTPSQDELEISHPLSFCEGPKGGGKPWVISGDTGIHPSATGYAQMASQVPAPGS
jgi:lysophospholipase L1-like esterase